MAATEKSFLQFLTERKQFIIPVFQRPYSWTLVDCLQFWESVISVADALDQQSCFMGSIICLSIEDNNIGNVATHIIDGQQRTVTLSLLLIALANTLSDSPESTEFTRESIYNQYLINSPIKDNQRYRLSLTRSDRDTFIKIIDQPKHILPFAKKGSHLIENYLFFVYKIRQSSIGRLKLYRCLKRLTIAEVKLQGGYDQALSIFERINSSGQSLTQSDLIRSHG